MTGEEEGSGVMPMYNYTRLVPDTSNINFCCNSIAMHRACRFQISDFVLGLKVIPECQVIGYRYWK